MDAGKRTRLGELILLLAVAYLPALVGSLLLFSGALPYTNNPGAQHVRLLLGAVLEAAYVALLFYILFRQGRRVRNLGFSFRWRDIPVSLLIAAGVALIALGPTCWTGLHPYFGLLPGGPLPGRERAWALVPAGVGALASQLVYRAYCICELEYLTGRKSIAVAGSVLLQVSYQWPFGVVFVAVKAAAYLVFSLYYVVARRITPVILADLYLSLLSLVI